VARSRALLVVAVLAAVLLWSVAGPKGDGGAPRPPGQAADDGGTGSGADGGGGDGDDPAPPDHALDDTEHGAGGGDDHPAAVTWYEQLSTLPVDDVVGLIDGGVGSDLDAAVRRAAARAAAGFVVADLSGVGRDEFPTWWGGEQATAAPALACCTDVEVLAAGAASYPEEEPLVLALVVWAATPVDGVSQFDAWEASFVFLHPAPDGGFTPVDPSTVGTWRAPAGLGLPAA
jgi:hypothetical protein